jgi:hypothetical protein
MLLFLMSKPLFLGAEADPCIEPVQILNMDEI